MPSKIFKNGRIFTSNPSKPWADAMAIDSAGKIAWVGTVAEVETTVGDGSELVDLKGGIGMPGTQKQAIESFEA
jgi:predicted amidohydrolase YtcJ